MLLRLTGYLLALAGFCMFILDGAQSIAASEVVVTSFGATWSSLAPESFASARAAVELRAGLFLWDPVATTVLQLPIFLVALAGGLAIAAVDTAIDASLVRLGWKAAPSRGY